MAAGGGVTLNRYFINSLTEQDISDLKAGNLHIVFAGLMIYRDVFGKTRRVTFKFNSERPKDGLTDVYFRVCSRGNRSN